VQGWVNIAMEGKHLCLIVCSGTIGVRDPFLIPFVGRDGSAGEESAWPVVEDHLGFDRDEMCFKSGAEIIPTAKIGFVRASAVCCRSLAHSPVEVAEFEVGESTRNAFAIGSEDILIEKVVGFEGRPK